MSREPASILDVARALLTGETAARVMANRGSPNLGALLCHHRTDFTLFMSETGWRA
jgi:hypothetical protein